MDLSRFTTKAREAIEQSVSLALSKSHSEVDGCHLMHSIIHQQEGVFPRVIKNLNLDIKHIQSQIDSLISSLPKLTSNSSGYQPSIGMELQQVLMHAPSIAQKLKDEYVSVEHLVLGLMEKSQQSKSVEFLSSIGITHLCFKVFKAQF